MTKIGLLFLICGISLLFSHGNVTPQPVNIKGLKKLTKDYIKNPFRGNEKARKIGKGAYEDNCARCHGIEAMSGGIAPDLRYLEYQDDDADEWFIEKVMNGSVRNGNVYMPPFKGIMQQEAMWSIRVYVESLTKKMK